MPTEDRPRILFATSNFPRWQGDSTTPFVLHLAQDLTALGWTVDVLAPHAPGASLVETMGGVRVERFRYMWPISMQTVCYGGGALANLERNRGSLIKLPFLVGAELLAVAKRLRKHRYALAHSHWMLPQGFNTSVVAGVLGVPHVLTVHGSDVLALRGRTLRPFKRAALRGADVVTVNSSATEREVRLLGVPSVPLERIPMGVKEPIPDVARRQRATDLRQRHRRGSGPLLLFVGRLAEEKGWRDLIAAIALLREAGSDATVLMVGDGPDREEAERLVSEFGVAGRVHLTGWIDHGEIATYLEAADIFLAPSCTTATGRSEAQGLALAEAMMSGRPVITTRVGGIGDFVQHGQTGWLVGERSPEELAMAVRQLHTDGELAGRLGAAAQLYASRHLSRGQTAMAFDRLYTRLTSSGREDALADELPENGAATRRAARADSFPGATHKSAVRILVLRHRSDSLASYGGPVYTASVMRLFENGPMQADVHELSFERQPSRPVHLMRNLWAMLRSLTSSLPAKVLRFRSGRFERRLQKLLDTERYDLVMVSGLEMLWCRPLLQRISPLLYLCHNLEADLYRRQVGRLPTWLSLARRDARKLEEFEQREVACADAVITIAPSDREVLSGLAEGVPMLAVPPSFSYARWDDGGFDTASVELPIRLGFMGNFGWWPNHSAIDWFLTQVWPETPEYFELHLFGSGSERLARLPRVTGHGFVDELGDVWAQAQIMIQPIVVAAGLNIKVAETAYNRRPMIATRAALEGFGFEPDPAIVVADTADEWISCLRGPEPRVLPGRRVSLANADRFDKTRNAGKLAQFTRSVIDRSVLRHKEGAK